MRKLAIAVAWIALGVSNSGFVNANLQHRFDDSEDYKCKSYRSDLAFSVGWSALFSPIAIVLTPFVTGFYEYGWRLQPRVECEVRQ